MIIEDSKGRGLIATEVDKYHCFHCLYGEIPDWAEPPFPICLKHMDVVLFILEKADIEAEVIEPQ